ncbi:MAG: hypothetical protein QME66_12215 [Candidatus Eisenbacteria bacterium]|nr:hypothetical protein [Candidatus Eisenbacteria bacterium]
MTRIGTLCAFVFAVLLLSLVSAATLFANPDPALMVYPFGISVYHYDGNEYKVVFPGEPGYDPQYDRRGKVLVNKTDLTVARDVYLANPVDFDQSSGEGEGYFTEVKNFMLTIRCWSNRATTFRSVYLFVSDNGMELTSLPMCTSDKCFFDLNVDGTKYTTPYLLGDIEVATPAAPHYSGEVTVHVKWTGECLYLVLGAFIDENGNGMPDPSEIKAPGSHDTTTDDPLMTDTVPISWGTLKAMYQ